MKLLTGLKKHFKSIRSVRICHPLESNFTADAMEFLKIFCGQLTNQLFLKQRSYNLINTHYFIAGFDIFIVYFCMSSHG